MTGDMGRADTSGAASGADSQGRSRRYPERPIAGVGGVILIDGKVLLIRRRFEPNAGRWSLPGGTLEVGETLQEGTAREMKEETGLDVEVGPVIDVFDRIIHDGDGRVQFHFVLVDFLCRPVGGTPAPSSDASDLTLTDPSDLGPYDLTEKTLEVIRRAIHMAANL